MTHPTCIGAVLLMSLLLGSCDTVEPIEEAQLVVEAFLDAGRPLPAVTLRQSRPLDEPYGTDSTTAANRARVMLRLDGDTIRYRPAAAPSGRYVPAAGAKRLVPAPSAFLLEVQWKDQQARAEGHVPVPVTLDAVQVQVPDEPVESVLLDSLRLDTLNSNVRQGFIYPIEVTLRWQDASGADSAYWVRPHLAPDASFSEAAVDFFLRQEEIQPEQGLPRGPDGRRYWTGVYAVPVERRSDPVPAHRLRAALLRSTAAYARYADSRSQPVRREPVSNVQGALGIAAGVSVDSVWVSVE